MAEYYPSITRRPGNLIYNRDGTVWANYLLRGINTDPYQTGRIEACQDANARLFSALSYLPASDFLLLGVKAQTPADVIMQKCQLGVPGFDPNRFPTLTAQLNSLHSRIKIGERAEYQRVYWLSIGFPVYQSWGDRILSSVSVVDPHQRVDDRLIDELEERYFKAIPAQFRPLRTTPDDVRWVFDRARQRGITVPEWDVLANPSWSGLPEPLTADGRKVEFIRPVLDDSPGSFAQIDVHKNADEDSLLEELIKKVAEQNSSVVLDKRSALAATRHAFSSTRWGKMLSISNVETRSPEFPDGYKSFQSMLGVTRYPEQETFDINTFTYLVDQEVGCDADFALRFHFDQDALSKRAMRKAMRELNDEARANTQDEFDDEEYGDRRTEQREFRRTAKRETAPRGMKVAALFCFSHQNRQFLEDRVAEISAHFADHDFGIIHPVGGQFDFWQAMMPGSSCPPSVDRMKQTTTATLFGAYIPLRRTVIGDPLGMPIAVNKENALGQIVLLDIFTAAEKGNASMTVTGAKGKGKSHLQKLLTGFLIDTGCTVHLIDQDPDGEHVVFATTLTNTEVVDVFGGVDAADRRVSLDVLKCLPPNLAVSMFLTLWLPLLEFSANSREAELLTTLLEPRYRHDHGLTSTRKLIQHLEHNVPDERARELATRFRFWARQPIAGAFIDPEVANQVIEHEPFNAKAQLVIFRTHRQSLHRGAGQPTEPERFAAMAYTAIALMTTHRFAGIRTPCVFVGDEMHFQEGADVLNELIDRPDKTGRRLNNFYIASAQLAEVFRSKHYRLVNRKVLFGQLTRETAAEAFSYGDIPPTDRVVNKMVHDTSPLDENRKPEIGREGEGWYCDGVNIGEFQVLPHLLNQRRRYSDTSTSRMIRESDLAAMPARQLDPQR
ncbi:hypothetical protein [Mycolicibacterium llatzerense]|uniref:hypothetical protein n=1 Tax=Mycolicibacterium llatzerense TaxID=280871 RepID=UPI0008DE9F9D|nr:hypothetical protein [Mycolicibacterium llatzerense]